MSESSKDAGAPALAASGDDSKTEVASPSVNSNQAATTSTPGTDSKTSSSTPKETGKATEASTPADAGTTADSSKQEDKSSAKDVLDVSKQSADSIYSVEDDDDEPLPKTGVAAEARDGTTDASQVTGKKRGRDGDKPEGESREDRKKRRKAEKAARKEQRRMDRERRRAQVASVRDVMEDEAEVSGGDSGDEEYDDDMLDPMEKGFVVEDSAGRARDEAMRERALHEEIDEARERKEADEMQARIAARYGSGQKESYLEGLEQERRGEVMRAKVAERQRRYGAGVEDAVPLPSIKDPKLFMVPVIPGREEEIVLEIMERYYNMLYIKQDIAKSERLRDKSLTDVAPFTDPMYIKTVFTTPACSGYIFVSAFKKDRAETALRGIQGCQSYKIEMIPVNQMPQCLNINLKALTLKRGQWVRLRRGVYKGDLAQVIDTHSEGSRGLLRVIPRLDMSAIAERDAIRAQIRQLNERASRDDDESVTRKIQKLKEKMRATKTRRRPPAALFDPSEYKVAGAIPREQGVVEFRNSEFQFGYLLLKDQNVATLQLSEVCPTQDEISRFNTYINADEDDDEMHDQAEDMADGGAAKVQRVFMSGKYPFPLATQDAAGDVVHQRFLARSFLKDDRVVVVKGAEKGAVGTVLRTEGDNVVIHPDGFEDGSEWTFLSEALAKHFRVGDHVKIISGVHKGQSGLIMKLGTQAASGDAAVQESMLVFTDVTNKKIWTTGWDLVKTDDVSAGSMSVYGYRLYDLVMLKSGEAACVVELYHDSFSVLLSNGSTQTVRGPQIQRSLSVRHNTAADSHGNEISQGALVKPFSGPMRGREGLVKYIYKGNLFLHSRAFRKNSGMFVCRASNVSLSQLGGQQLRNDAQWNPAALSFVDKDRAEKYGRAAVVQVGGRGRRMGSRNYDNPNDALINQKVTITRGHYKGRVGIVRGTQGTDLRVELHAVMKTVTVPGAFVEIKKKGKTFSFAKGSKRRRGMQSRRPGAALPGATPGGFTGGFTGGVTPMSGGVTPGGMTPFGATPFAGGGVTPFMGGATGGVTPGGGLTPGGGITPEGGGVTPMYETKSVSSYGSSASSQSYPTGATVRVGGSTGVVLGRQGDQYQMQVGGAKVTRPATSITGPVAVQEGQAVIGLSGPRHGQSGFVLSVIPGRDQVRVRWNNGTNEVVNRHSVTKKAQ